MPLFSVFGGENKTPKSINLLYSVVEPEDKWEKIYKWAVTTGRYMIIFVELMVLIAFCSRFYLDRRHNDLKDAIEEQTRFIQTYAAQEKEIRDIQVKLIDIQKLLDKQETNSLSTEFKKIVNYVPEGVTVHSLIVSTRGVQGKCTSASYDSMTKMEDQVRADQDYDNVKFRLSKGSSSDISFSFEFSYKEEEKGGTKK